MPLAICGLIALVALLLWLHGRHKRKVAASSAASVAPWAEGQYPFTAGTNVASWSMREGPFGSTSREMNPYSAGATAHQGMNRYDGGGPYDTGSEPRARPVSMPCSTHYDAPSRHGSAGEDRFTRIPGIDYSRQRIGRNGSIWVPLSSRSETSHWDDPSHSSKRRSMPAAVYMDDRARSESSLACPLPDEGRGCGVSDARGRGRSASLERCGCSSAPSSSRCAPPSDHRATWSGPPPSTSYTPHREYTLEPAYPDRAALPSRATSRSYRTPAPSSPRTFYTAVSDGGDDYLAHILPRPSAHRHAHSEGHPPSLTRDISTAPTSRSASSTLYEHEREDLSPLLEYYMHRSSTSGTSGTGGSFGGSLPSPFGRHSCRGGGGGSAPASRSVSFEGSEPGHNGVSQVSTVRRYAPLPALPEESDGELRRALKGILRRDGHHSTSEMGPRQYMRPLEGEI